MLFSNSLEKIISLLSKKNLIKWNKEVEEANQRRLEEERRYEEQLIHQAKQIQDKEYEVKLLALRVKEREKELRLQELKAKEYKRQIRHNSLKPMAKDTGYSLEAIMSPRYEPFHGAKMRYQQ